MNRYFIFLRAINVGGHSVKMDELSRIFREMGYPRIETFIASGNIVLDSTETNVKTMNLKMEKHLRKALGFDVAAFIRTQSELHEIAVYQPFDVQRLEAAQALNIAFLKEPLPADLQTTLLGLKSDIDDFHMNGREVYWLCKLKQSDSKFSNAVFERKLGVQTTFRGFNTLVKLAAKYP